MAVLLASDSRIPAPLPPRMSSDRSFLVQSWRWEKSSPELEVKVMRNESRVCGSSREDIHQRASWNSGFDQPSWTSNITQNHISEATVAGCKFRLQDLGTATWSQAGSLCCSATPGRIAPLLGPSSCAGSHRHWLHESCILLGFPSFPEPQSTSPLWVTRHYPMLPSPPQGC